MSKCYTSGAIARTPQRNWEKHHLWAQSLDLTEVIHILMKDNIFDNQAGEQAESDSAISEGTAGLQLQKLSQHLEKWFRCSAKLTISTLPLELSP